MLAVLRVHKGARKSKKERREKERTRETKRASASFFFFDLKTTVRHFLFQKESKSSIGSLFFPLLFFILRQLFPHGIA